MEGAEWDASPGRGHPFGISCHTWSISDICCCLWASAPDLPCSHLPRLGSVPTGPFWVPGGCGCPRRGEAITCVPLPRAGARSPWNHHPLLSQGLPPSRRALPWGPHLMVCWKWSLKMPKIICLGGAAAGGGVFLQRRNRSCSYRRGWLLLPQTGEKGWGMKKGTRRFVSHGVALLFEGTRGSARAKQQPPPCTRWSSPAACAHRVCTQEPTDVSAVCKGSMPTVHPGF